MKIFLTFFLCLFLTSCATHMNNRMSFAQAERIKWTAKAKADDADAQYRLGNAYCCGASGYFQTQKAIDWWCKASRKGHIEAQKALIKYDRTQQCKPNSQAANPTYIKKY